MEIKLNMYLYKYLNIEIINKEILMSETVPPVFSALSEGCSILPSGISGYEDSEGEII